MEVCETEARLSGLLDGELTGDELERLQAHLEACASCRQLLQDLRRVEESLSSVLLPEPAQWEARWQNIVQGARPRREAVHGEGSRLRAWLLGRRLRWGLAVAACLLALAVGSQVLHTILSRERPATAIELASPGSWEVELDQTEGQPGAVLLVSQDGDVALVWITGEEPPPPVPRI